MRRIVFLIAAFLLCIAVVKADSGISVGNTYQVDDAVRIGISNNNNYDLDNARVRLFIPELGIISRSVTVDLDDDERSLVRLYLLDEVPEGEYLVRISVKKGSHRKIVHRYVVFG